MIILQEFFVIISGKLCELSERAHGRIKYRSVSITTYHGKIHSFNGMVQQNYLSSWISVKNVTKFYIYKNP